MSTVAEDEKRKRLKDIETAMETAHGRRIIYRVLASSGCLARPVLFSDPAQISFAEGKRSVGFDIYADVVDAAPKKLQVMILEAQERQDRINERVKHEQEVMRDEE